MAVVCSGIVLFFEVALSYVQRKKTFTSFPSPAGMSLTKLPLGRNNSVMTSLFPPRESLVVTSRLGTGNSRSFFYGVDPLFLNRFYFLFLYFIRHCFICRPSDSTVSEDAGIEHRTVAILSLTFRRSKHSARSRPVLRAMYARHKYPPIPTWVLV